MAQDFLNLPNKTGQDTQNQYLQQIATNLGVTTDALNSAVNLANTAGNNANAKIIDVENRFNTLTTAQQQGSEVVDARKGEVSLKAKIDEMDEERRTHKAETVSDGVHGLPGISSVPLAGEIVLYDNLSGIKIGKTDYPSVKDNDDFNRPTHHIFNETTSFVLDSKIEIGTQNIGKSTNYYQTIIMAVVSRPGASGIKMGLYSIYATNNTGTTYNIVPIIENTDVTITYNSSIGKLVIANASGSDRQLVANAILI